jgi:hypothetical protein
MRVIAIGGVPGAGKSVLAAELSAVMAVTVLSKDVFLGTLVGAVGPARPRRAGAGPLAMQLALDVLATQSPPVRLIFDAPLWHRSAWQQLVRLRERGCDRLVSIICTAPSSIILARIARRVSLGDSVRPAAPLNASVIDARHRQIVAWSDEFDIPRLIVDTHANDPSVARAIAFVKGHLDD